MLDPETAEALKELLKVFPGSELMTPEECGCSWCREDIAEAKKKAKAGEAT